MTCEIIDFDAILGEDFECLPAWTGLDVHVFRRAAATARWSGHEWYLPEDYPDALASVQRTTAKEIRTSCLEHLCQANPRIRAYHLTRLPDPSILKTMGIQDNPEATLKDFLQRLRRDSVLGIDNAQWQDLERFIRAYPLIDNHLEKGLGPYVFLSRTAIDHPDQTQPHRKGPEVWQRATNAIRERLGIDVSEWLKRQTKGAIVTVDIPFTAIPFEQQPRMLSAILDAALVTMMDPSYYQDHPFTGTLAMRGRTIPATAVTAIEIVDS